MCFQVVLAYKVIVLCKCSGKYIDIYFKLKITFFYRFNINSIAKFLFYFHLRQYLLYRYFKVKDDITGSDNMQSISGYKRLMPRRLFIFHLFSIIIFIFISNYT